VLGTLTTSQQEVELLVVSLQVTLTHEHIHSVTSFLPMVLESIDNCHLALLTLQELEKVIFPIPAFLLHCQPEVSAAGHFLSSWKYRSYSKGRPMFDSL
jgi:hypothetical protein